MQNLFYQFLYPTDDWCFMKIYAMLKFTHQEIIEKMQLLMKNVRTYLCKKMQGNLNAITGKVSYYRNKSIFQSNYHNQYMDHENYTS